MTIARTGDNIPGAPTKAAYDLAHQDGLLPQTTSEAELAKSNYPPRADSFGRVAIDTRSWQDYANCMGVDPDLFFPERGASVREAKEVCKSCVVREDCLEYALSNGETHGIWGGLSERERRRIRRQRAIARRAALESEATKDASNAPA